MAVNIRALAARLNRVCRHAMDSAIGLCVSRTHYEVDIEHILLKLLEVENSDVQKILAQADILPLTIEHELQNSINSFRAGNTRTPVLSPRLAEIIEQAWIFASAECGELHIRSGHLLFALLMDDHLRRMVATSCPALAAINATVWQPAFHEVVATSVEAGEARPIERASVDAGSGNPPEKFGPISASPYLGKFCLNLTQQAREGKLDPVIGRDEEIRQMMDVLLRRRQNNPILTGEPGVGKTALAEGLAMRIAANDVPAALRNVELLSLDMGLLQAGASIKGEFENRLKNVIEEVKRSIKPVILFIDEAHTLIGAGGQAGQNDAANLMKPALARGEMRTIAATTWSEYKKYFEKDAALDRRFQVIKVEEPDEDKAIAMLRATASAMASHHGVRILDEAVAEAVKLSSRYITGRQLPDKAISVLDTACAKAVLGQESTPNALEVAQRRIERLETERAVLKREAATGIDHDARLHDIGSEHATAIQHQKDLEARIAEEKTLVDGIRASIASLELLPLEVDERRAMLARLDVLRVKLRAIQGASPLISAEVDANSVAQVVAAWTGIPVGKMVTSEIQAVLNLHDSLAERVVGQMHAIDAITQRVRTCRANLDEPNKPKGVFLLVGPSGVGKTETAIALADALYGGERNMITINLSEYQEAHTVSGLKGSPPGYVGHGKGGILTEAVRRRPHSVVLLDEIEKAHPDVLELFFQVFDKGRMKDSEGCEIDFKNTFIILTSNIGAHTIMQACMNQPVAPSAADLIEVLRPKLQEAFKPAFLGRCVVIPYYPLQDEDVKRIVRMKLDNIGQRIARNHCARFGYDDAFVGAVAARCTETDSGARNIDNILTGTLLPEIASEILSRAVDARAIKSIQARLDDAERFWCEFA